MFGMTRPGWIRALVRTIFATLIAATTLLGSSVAATADEDIRGNSTGGGWVVGEKEMHLTAQEKSDVAAKQRLWDAYSDRVAGKLSPAEYNAIERRTERALDIQLNAPVQAARACACPPPPAPCPSKVLLSVKHSAQGTTFTCGNTTGYMIAKYEGRKRSRFNHARLTGKNMGGRKHMRTYVNESTPWASKNFKRGLNRWLRGKARGFYQQHATPSVRRYRKALRYDTDHGHPFGASTIEFAGSRENPRPHYNGHPKDKTIGHWIVARGYSKGTRRSHFLDPAAKSRALSNYTGSKRFTMKSKRLVRTFLRPGHGIAA